MIGRVYKIVHNQSDITYVGSTTTSLSRRWGCYKSEAKSDNNSKNSTSIGLIIQKYGIKNFKMILIKEYEVIDKKHLFVYETLWINKLNCINQVTSFNPMNKSLKDKSYYQRNKDRIKSQVKQYASQNKDKIREMSKIYREKNKDKIREKKKEKFLCDCGVSTLKGHRLRHFRSKQHQKWEQMNNSQ